MASNCPPCDEDDAMDVDFGFGTNEPLDIDIMNLSQLAPHDYPIGQLQGNEQQPPSLNALTDGNVGFYNVPVDSSSFLVMNSRSLLPSSHAQSRSIPTTGFYHNKNTHGSIPQARESNILARPHLANGLGSAIRDYGASNMFGSQGFSSNAQGEPRWIVSRSDIREAKSTSTNRLIGSNIPRQHSSYPRAQQKQAEITPQQQSYQPFIPLQYGQHNLENHRQDISQPDTAQPLQLIVGDAYMKNSSGHVLKYVKAPPNSVLKEVPCPDPTCTSCLFTPKTDVKQKIVEKVVIVDPRMYHEDEMTLLVQAHPKPPCLRKQVQQLEDHWKTRDIQRHRQMRRHQQQQLSGSFGNSPQSGSWNLRQQFANPDAVLGQIQATIPLQGQKHQLQQEQPQISNPLQLPPNARHQVQKDTNLQQMQPQPQDRLRRNVRSCAKCLNKINCCHCTGTEAAGF